MSLAREHQKNFKGLFEQSEDLFKPIIEEQEKQIVKLNEALEEQQKQTAARKEL